MEYINLSAINIFEQYKHKINDIIPYGCNCIKMYKKKLM